LVNPIWNAFWTIRMGLAAALEGAGYVVATAGNAREALDYLRDHLPPALILLDMMMPAADGWHFVRRRAQNAALAAIPVLITTALGIAAEAWATGLGACGLLHKPFDTDVLLAAVKRCLEKAGPA
jgi:CheY-like chemotaxis protein